MFDKYRQTLVAQLKSNKKEISIFVAGVALGTATAILTVKHGPATKLLITPEQLKSVMDIPETSMNWDTGVGRVIMLKTTE